MCLEGSRQEYVLGLRKRVCGERERLRNQGKRNDESMSRKDLKLISQGGYDGSKEKKKKRKKKNRRIPLSTSQEGGRRLRDCRSPGWVVWIVLE